MCKIRPYESRDAQAVSRVIRTTMHISNTADYPLARVQPLIDYFSPQKVDQLNQERFCLVAEIESPHDPTRTHNVVGTIGIEGNELVTFFVLPSFQGQGIGRMLLDAIEAHAAMQGLTAVCVASSLTAETFYARRGYQRIAPPYEGTAGLQILMQKTLKSDQ